MQAIRIVGPSRFPSFDADPPPSTAAELQRRAQAVIDELDEFVRYKRLFAPGHAAHSCKNYANATDELHGICQCNH